MEGDFKNWKIYNNPDGYANTNSPIESFNASLKRSLKRKRLSCNLFMESLMDIVRTTQRSLLLSLMKEANSTKKL